MKIVQGPPLDPEEKKNFSFYWFIFSLILFVSAVWSILDEGVIRRPWKRVQATFNKIEKKQLSELRDAEAKRLQEEQGDKIKELDQQIAQSQVERRSGDFSTMQKGVARKEKEFKELEQSRSFAKADLDETYYLLDHAKVLGKSEKAVKELEEKIAKEKQLLAEAAEKAAAAEKEYNELQAALLAKEKELAAPEFQKEELFKNLAELEKKISGVESRSIEIKQVVAEGLDRFGRVDRCETCHTSIRRAGFEDQPNPYKTHPRMAELFGSHPPEKFGCTSCHHGDGRALRSAFAAHAYEVVKGEKEGEEHVHYKHHWLQPMYRGPFQEAACNDCHGNQFQIKGGDTWTYANKLFVELGCHGCHLVKGFENLDKVGPDLRRVSHKVNPEWLVAWIKEPTSYNPTTRMPNFRLSEDEAKALAAFLLSNSEKDYVLTDRYWGGANAAAGKELVQTIGCRACHVVGEGREAYDEFRAKDRPTGDVGPELTRIARKASGDWLVSWLKNPRSYSPHTQMPSLRLSDSEARNIAAYLLSLDKPTPADAALRQQLQDPQLIQTGRNLVNKRGCYGCHMIKDFENGERIGPELTTFGMKDAHELAFGPTLDKNPTVKVEETWEDWTRHKLQSPDVFDTDRQQALMPTFTWRAGETDAMLVFLKAQDGVQEKAPWWRERDGRFEAIDRGQRLVAQYNCIACHSIEGRGGWIQGTLPPEQQTYMAPPSLQGAGGKIQADWLFRFLNRPTTVRPWLKVRMPSFNLTDQEFNDIIRYFQALDGVNLSFEDLSRVSISSKNMQTGHALFNSNACLSCHVIGGVPAGMSEARKASLAPNLKLARERLRYDWIEAWLADPAKIVPGTRMPAFWDATTKSTLDELASLQKDLGAAKTDDERAGLQKDIDAIHKRMQEAHTEIKAVRDYLYSL